MDVAVDVVAPDPVDQPIDLQDGPNVRLHPGKAQRDPLCVGELLDLGQLRGSLVDHIRKGVDASRIVDPDAWVPEDQPSFPLPAKNPLELIWAAAVSIYGKADAVRPFEADHDKKAFLRS